MVLSPDLSGQTEFGLQPGRNHFLFQKLMIATKGHKEHEVLHEPIWSVFLRALRALRALRSDSEKIVKGMIVMGMERRAGKLFL